ncbi:Gfo/Idh/MocA family oxidoreductase [Roseiconus nitratireducens]|uniref:Gfo/Idh/MocA family oxidoreductase n=1 Tax=Roseiconus nitratireducens TaxID=2605748 RepID=A0A5M6D6J7_9BACT|nr:Gfo/Idh/MocA family oxidoreductase [Roseiconus nitratireducens]KAA5543167.1 Gfo/Idh/MocA family oxidoreductase [Roseiconus nitratireducens]
MTRLRVAVIGAGHLGRIHAKLLSSVDGAELVGISDPIESARQNARKLFGVPTVADYRELIDQVDAAIIAAPTDAHAEIATDLLKSGKHLLVEKPLATTAADANKLAMLASARRLTLQVGHVERFNPAFTSLEQLSVDTKYVEAVRASRFPGRCLDVGVVMDLMIHDIDLVCSMTEAPVRHVAASGLAVVSDHEDLAEARVEFECGLVANLKASRISPTPARSMQVFGSNGFAEIDFSGPALHTVRPSTSLVERTFDLEVATDNPLQYADELFRDHLGIETRELEPRNAILDELHDFVISIQSGMLPTVSGADGARAVTIAEAILDSIKHRQWYGDATPSEIGPLASVRPRIDAPSRTRKAA